MVRLGLCTQTTNTDVKRKGPTPPYIRGDLEKKEKWQSQQGTWIRWEEMTKQRIKWLDIWSTNYNQLKSWCRQYTYCQVPQTSTPEIKQSPQFAHSVQVEGHCSTLSGCSKAFSNGWYHDQILKTIADTIDTTFWVNSLKPNSTVH